MPVIAANGANALTSIRHGDYTGRLKAARRSVLMNQQPTNSKAGLQLASCSVELIDTLDLSTVRAAVERLKPSLIVCEVVSNPLLRVTDIPEIVAIAKPARATVLVDATFSPTLYEPAVDGAQLVVHSLTKY